MTPAIHAHDAVRVLRDVYGFDCYVTSNHRVAIFDDGTRSGWAVSPEDAEDLIARLAGGQPDAYSLWCGDTEAEELGD